MTQLDKHIKMYKNVIDANWDFYVTLPNSSNKQKVFKELVGLSSNTLVSYYIHLNLIKHGLLVKNDWLNDIQITSVNIKQKYTNNYVTNIKVGLFVVYFSGVEAKLRELYEIIFSKKTKDLKFSQIYKELFKSLGTSNGAVAFFFFLSKIRNTIHTNGYYNKADFSYELNGHKYEIKKESYLNLLTEDLLYDIYNELLILFKVMKIKIS